MFTYSPLEISGACFPTWSAKSDSLPFKQCKGKN